MKVLNLTEMQQVSGAAYDVSAAVDLTGTGSVEDATAIMTALGVFMGDPTQGQAFIDALNAAGVDMNQMTLRNFSIATA